MNTLRKHMIAFLGVSALVLGAACSDNGGQDPTSGPEPGGDGGEQVTLQFWSWNPDDTVAVRYIEAFEAEHDDITIEHRFIQYSDYVNTTQLALQSDSGPDIFGVQVGALTNQFAPLAEDLTPFLEDKLGADWRDQLTATDQLVVDDKQVAAPWMVTGGGMMWANQNLLDDLGLEAPTTKAELDAFCEVVKADGKYCMMQGAQDAWQNIDVFHTLVNQIAPGEFQAAMAGEVQFDSATFVEAFELWKTFFDDGVFQDGALGITAYPDANDAMKQGEVALIAMGTWQNGDTTATRLAEYTDRYGMDMSERIFMPYPFPALVEGADTSILFGGPDVGFAISQSSEHKEAAATFLTWLTADEAGQSMMATTVQQPALSSVPLDLSDVVTDEQREALEAQGPALANMIGAREIESADVRVALGDALSAVASDQQSPEDAATAVQAAIDAVN